MNKWLALYAVLCITTIIGLAQLGWEYETEGYGLHPAIAGSNVLLVGLGYCLIAKLFTKYAPKPQSLINIRSAQIISDARNDPRYLKDVGHLCEIIHRRYDETMITGAERCAALDAISESLNGQVFLFSHLKQQGKITYEFGWDTILYHNEAHKHWDNLIAQLKG